MWLRKPRFRSSHRKTATDWKTTAPWIPVIRAGISIHGRDSIGPYSLVAEHHVDYALIIFFYPSSLCQLTLVIHVYKKWIIWMDCDIISGGGMMIQSDVDGHVMSVIFFARSDSSLAWHTHTRCKANVLPPRQSACESRINVRKSVFTGPFAFKTCWRWDHVWCLDDRYKLNRVLRRLLWLSHGDVTFRWYRYVYFLFFFFLALSFFLSSYFSLFVTSSRA